MRYDNALNFLRLAIAADAEKIQTMTQNFEVILFSNLFFHLIQAVENRINDFSALDADQMGMGIGFLSVVSVAAVGESQLKHFPQVFYQYNISVYRGKTHGWKIGLDLMINILHRWMAFAFRQNSDDGQPLWGDLVTIFSQLFENDIESCIIIFQRRTF